MEDVAEDFKHELNNNNFPFKDLIVGNKVYSEILFDEFEALTPIDKPIIYIRENFGNANKRKAFRDSLLNDITKPNGDTEHDQYIADYVSRLSAEIGTLPKVYQDLTSPFTQIEEKFFYFLKLDFFNSGIKGSYLGRFIDGTPTVKAVKGINDALLGIDAYILKTDDEKNFYQKDAEKIANKILSFLDGKEFKNELLNTILTTDEGISGAAVVESFTDTHKAKKIREKYNSYFDWVKNHLKKSLENENKPVPRPTKVDLIKLSLSEYGFFDLEKVKNLKDQSCLLELIVSNDAPYQIAMFDYLGFLRHILINHSNNIVDKRNKLISEIINVGSDTVKKNILTLNLLASHTDEFRKRYTAHTFIHAVQVDLNGCK